MESNPGRADLEAAALPLSYTDKCLTVAATPPATLATWTSGRMLAVINPRRAGNEVSEAPYCSIGAGPLRGFVKQPLCICPRSGDNGDQR